MDAKDVINAYIESVDTESEHVNGNFVSKKAMLCTLLTEGAINNDTFIMGQLVIDLIEAMHMTM